MDGEVVDALGGVCWVFAGGRGDQIVLPLGGPLGLGGCFDSIRAKGGQIV